MADEVLTWIAPDGAQTILNAGALDVGWDMQGRYMPPVEFVEDDVPAQDGSYLRQVRVRPREVAIPIDVLVSNLEALRPLMRTLVKTFSPTRGDGRLRVLSADGKSRELTCRYKQGLEVQEEFRAALGQQRSVIIFRATDPFWYDTTPLTVTLTTGVSSNFLGDPFLPVRLASDSVLGMQTVTNDGDVEAWPVWTVNGPITSLLLQNLTTGLSINLPVTLAAGQTLIIDTRPLRKTIRRNDGVNLYGSLVVNATSALWPLVDGANSLNIVANGSTAASYVTLVYSRRYLSP